MVRIAVDAMGGDFAPRAIVEGVGEFLDCQGDGYRLLLVGEQTQLEQELSRIGKRGDPRLDIVHANEIVHMHEAAAATMRAKRGASINVAVDLVKKGEASAVVSAGHTGAAVASTVVKLRMLPGIERPGIAPVFPSPAGHFVLLDAGANVDCKPIHLVHYAVMGDAFARHILQRPQPRIGLLSVGGEDSKGNDLTKGAFKLLEEIKDLNFVGNVEGHDLFSGKVDVVICDGFVGNAVLKCCESLAEAVGHILKEKLQKNPLRTLGYLLSRGAYRELRSMTDYAEHGGAPLLGVNGVCIISHGASSPRAVRNAIRVAGEFVEHQVNQQIVTRVEHLGLAPAKAAEA